VYNDTKESFCETLVITYEHPRQLRFYFFTAVSENVTFFVDVTRCSLTGASSFSLEQAGYTLRPEDGGSTLFKNVNSSL